MPQHIPPQSGSSYIIICNGRIARAIAKTQDERITAASQCAMRLTTYLSLRYRQYFQSADCYNLSVLQHALMDHVNGVKLSNEEVEAKIEQIFDECDALEAKYANIVY